MLLTILGSSSKGNCYLIEAENEDKLILDAGINFREVQANLNFDFEGLLGVLITHEHMDHFKYATNFAEYGINVYASEGTFQSKNVKGHRFKVIKALQQFEIGNFIILPFDTQHDAAEPLGFLIQYKPTGEKLLYATDTYYIKYKFKNLNYILLECNYIKDIARKNVENGIINKARYTRLLESHLSLENAVKLLKANDLSNVKNIVLCHLSNDNSDEIIMEKTIFDVTNIDTTIAKSNMMLDLRLYPF